MKQQQNTGNRQNDCERNKNHNTPIGAIAGISIAIGLFVVGVAVLGWLIHDYIPLGERGKLFTESAFSLAIVIAIVIQTGLYFRQAAALDAQLDISKQHVKITKDSVITAHKAWVGVHSIKTDKSQWWVFVKIENVGRMPARDITVDIDLIVFPSFDPPEDIWKNREIVSHPVIKKYYDLTELFSGNLQIMECVHLLDYLTAAQLEKDVAQEKRVSLFLRGFITYWTGFKGQPADRTGFFFRYHPEENFWAVEAPPPWYVRLQLQDAQKEQRNANK